MGGGLKTKEEACLYFLGVLAPSASIVHLPELPWAPLPRFGLLDILVHQYNLIDHQSTVSNSISSCSLSLKVENGARSPKLLTNVCLWTANPRHQVIWGWLKFISLFWRKCHLWSKSSGPSLFREAINYSHRGYLGDKDEMPSMVWEDNDPSEGKENWRGGFFQSWLPWESRLPRASKNLC